MLPNFDECVQILSRMTCDMWLVIIGFLVWRFVITKVRAVNFEWQDVVIDWIYEWNRTPSYYT